MPAPDANGRVIEPEVPAPLATRVQVPVLTESVRPVTGPDSVEAIPMPLALSAAVKGIEMLDPVLVDGTDPIVDVGVPVSRSV